MRSYDVLVRYRTNSGINAAYHTVSADSPFEAIRIAESERRGRRGVVRIDSSHAVEIREESSQGEQSRRDYLEYAADSDEAIESRILLATNKALDSVFGPIAKK